MSKEFYGKTFINTNSDNERYGKQIELEYFKTQGKQENANTYGIEIIKTQMNGNKIYVEKKQINSITSYENKAYKMLELLKRHKVTPVAMPYIIEDIVNG